MSEATPEHLEGLMAMLKRRGYIQPAYELYGGVAGFYDYGPLGQGLKRNFEALWRQAYVVEEGFGEVSTPTVAPEDVFIASGHVGHFADVVIECPSCGSASRADHFLVEEYDRLEAAVEQRSRELADQGLEGLDQAREFLLGQLREHRAAIEFSADAETVRRLLSLAEGEDDGEEPVPVEQAFGPLTLHHLASRFRLVDADGEVLLAGEVRCRSCDAALTGAAETGPFNLMFPTRIGPAGGQQGYIRPETAQGMFVTFDWLYRFNREQVPFGAVQIGRAYRNEISPRQGLLRLREFWQAEAEVFVDPQDKRHPAFTEVADTEVLLVPDGQDPLRMTLGDAVEKGVVGNEQVAYYIAKTQRILLEAGLDPEKLRFRQHESDEMAHYASDCWDAEFHSDRYDWVESVGIADRGCYDLEAHIEHSGQDLSAFRPYDEPVEETVVRIAPDMAKLGPLFKGRAQDIAAALEEMDALTVNQGEPILLELGAESFEVPPEAFEVERETIRKQGERFVPHVIEPSYGIDRILYAVLEHNYDPSGEWTVLRLPPHVAPIQVGVLPLVSKDGLPERAQQLLRELRGRGLVAHYDQGGSIGRRYARLDEVGTPFAITIDHETLENGVVTIRDRDSQEQVRVEVARAAQVVEDLVEGRVAFGEL